VPDNRRIADELADLLTQLADAVRKAAKGDEQAKAFIRAHMDNYWGAIVVGNCRSMDVSKLVGEPEVEVPEDSDEPF
jgi:hypothetical protein